MHNAKLKLTHIIGRLPLLKILFSILIICIAGAYYTQTSHMPNSVFKIHVYKAFLMEKGEDFLLQFGIFVLAILLKYVIHCTLNTAFIYLCSFHVLLTFLALSQFLEWFSARDADKNHLCWFALALMIIGPIGIPFLVDPMTYNFTDINRYILLLRNTTYTSAQPYVILAFTYFCFLLNDALKNKKSNRKTLVLAAGTLWLSVVMKPNFALSFIPALGITTLIYTRSMRTAMVMLLLSVPSLITIAAQYYIGFADSPHTTGSDLIAHSHTSWEHVTFRFAPWAVWVKNNGSVWLSFVLATLFPLHIAVSRRKHLSPFTILAWINLGITVMPYALLQQTNNGGDRDFEWGFWFGLHVLFIASFLELLRWPKAEKPALLNPFQRDISVALFTLHVLFGFARLLHSLLTLT